MTLHDKMDARVNAALRNAGRRNSVLTFEAYEPDDDEEPARDNLDDVAIEGPCVLVRRDSPWIKAEYESPGLNNPTWLELCVLVDEMMRITGDTHHSFFEGVRKTQHNPIDGLPVYEFVLGS